MADHGSSASSRKLRHESSKSKSVDPSPKAPLTKNRRGGLVDASAGQSGTNTLSRRQPRKVLDQDPNTPEGLAELHRLVPTLTTADQVADVLSDLYIAVKEFPPAVRDLEGALKLRRVAIHQQAVAVPVNAVANPVAATVANLPSWRDLGTYATTLPEPQEGDKPHPVADHLRQRIGELKNGKRKRVLARKIEGNKLTLVDVTEQNFQQVDPERYQEMLRDWMKETKVMRKEFRGYGEELSDATVKTRVSQALEDILKWVEPEILNAIGLPKIIVHGPKARTSPEAYYSAEEQTIHIQDTKFTRERIRHEFGHHIEEQGPIETWCGFASYLQALTPDRELVDHLKYVAPQYGWNWENGEPRLPNPLYALVYYGDASTELLSLGLEYGVPADPERHVDWSDKLREAEIYDSAYVALLMQAIRPNQVRAAGVTLPTLMQ